MTCPVVALAKTHHRDLRWVTFDPVTRHNSGAILRPISHANATLGADDKTNPTRNTRLEAPLTGVLALATTPVSADRSHLSEGHPE